MQDTFVQPFPGILWIALQGNLCALLEKQHLHTAGNGCCSSSFAHYLLICYQFAVAICAIIMNLHDALIYFKVAWTCTCGLSLAMIALTLADILNQLSVRGDRNNLLVCWQTNTRCPCCLCCWHLNWTKLKQSKASRDSPGRERMYANCIQMPRPCAKKHWRRAFDYPVALLLARDSSFDSPQRTAVGVADCLPDLPGLSGLPLWSCIHMQYVSL